MSWEIRSKVEKIVDSNCKEIPYEGTEVNKYQMKADLYDYILSLLPKNDKEDDNRN